MKNTEHLTDAVQSLQEQLGDDLLAVALGDIRSLEFDPAYVRDDTSGMWESVEEFFSDETQREIFENIAAEAFFETGEGDSRSPLGELRFTVRHYTEAMIVIGWLNSNTVVVTLRPAAEHIPSTIRILETTLPVDEAE